jgi:hypothetical protein
LSEELDFTFDAGELEWPAHFYADGQPGVNEFLQSFISAVFSKAFWDRANTQDDR